MTNVGAWKFPESIDVEGDFKIALDMDAIQERMTKLEDEAIRHSVITWLRARGYIVYRSTPATIATAPQPEQRDVIARWLFENFSPYWVTPSVWDRDEPGLEGFRESWRQKADALLAAVGGVS